MSLYVKVPSSDIKIDINDSLDEYVFDLYNIPDKNNPANIFWVDNSTIYKDSIEKRIIPSNPNKFDHALNTLKNKIAQELPYKPKMVDVKQLKRDRYGDFYTEPYKVAQINIGQILSDSIKNVNNYDEALNILSKTGNELFIKLMLIFKELSYTPDYQRAVLAHVIIEKLYSPEIPNQNLGLEMKIKDDMGFQNIKQLEELINSGQFEYRLNEIYNLQEVLAIDVFGDKSSLIISEQEAANKDMEIVCNYGDIVSNIIDIMLDAGTTNWGKQIPYSKVHEVEGPYLEYDTTLRDELFILLWQYRFDFAYDVARTLIN